MSLERGRRTTRSEGVDLSPSAVAAILPRLLLGNMCEKRFGIAVVGDNSVGVVVRRLERGHTALCDGHSTTLLGMAAGDKVRDFSTGC